MAKTKKVYEYKLVRTRANVCMDEVSPYNTLGIAEPAAISHMMKKLVGDSARKHLYAFFLNTKNIVIGYELLGVGAENWVHCSLVDLLRSALVCGGIGVILSHNHPTGYCQPSKEDDVLTQRVCAGLGAISIRLMDHVIVGENEFYSYANVGKLG
jgi:DNA repair protein RadC